MSQPGVVLKYHVFGSTGCLKSSATNFAKCIIHPYY